MVRTVNYVLQPVTASDCTNLNVSKQNDGSGGFVLVVTYTFGIRDEVGTVREYGSVSHQAAGSAQTNLAAYITANGVPLFNAANNL